MFKINLLFAIIMASCTTQVDSLKTVESVDLDKYQGKWYEIARYPNRFQKSCICCTTAEYQKTDKKHLVVINTCRKDSINGSVRSATGKAFPVKGSNNAKLKVQFFWPFRGDYWIIDLDTNYQWAVVSEPARRYLWILARNPVLDKDVLDGILNRLKTNGFGLSKLLYTKHK